MVLLMYTRALYPSYYYVFAASPTETHVLCPDIMISFGVNIFAEATAVSAPQVLQDLTLRSLLVETSLAIPSQSAVCKQSSAGISGVPG